MHDVAILAGKAVLGGTLVVVFSVIAELVQPKSFAGLFGAAPSIALAALIITVATNGAHAGYVQSQAMVFGAIAMLAYCIAATVTVDRFGALKGSLLSFAAWFATVGPFYTLVLSR